MQVMPLEHIIYVPKNTDEVAFRQVIEHTSPDLRAQPWCYLYLHDSWQDDGILEIDLEHLVIIASNQFPVVTTWRGSVVAVQDAATFTAFPMALRVPIFRRDLLLSLQFDDRTTDGSCSLHVRGDESSHDSDPDEPPDSDGHSNRSCSPVAKVSLLVPPPVIFHCGHGQIDHNH